ncbi:MAG TPA: MBL fold metallo-hydrolase [Bryobacteraceae bacterium]|nr:MBL fold metallo-hydrolase [Bryobacteraceae bacterium]
MKILGLAMLAAFCVSAASKTLDVYLIDVEGGKALLAISPAGESLLIDVGWPKLANREASTDRLVADLKAVGLKRLDTLVISHFDTDHMGDAPALAARFPIRRIVDHGALETSGKGVEARYHPYADLFHKIEHFPVKPGDSIAFKGAEITVVAAAGRVIDKPLKGGGAENPFCRSNKQADAIPQDAEDNASVGLLFTLGKFRMIDLADLEAHKDWDLVCPDNLIGRVDVYQVNVHGQFKGMSTALVNALHPRVAMMGNGARKGGDAETWPVLRATPGLEDIWQSHFSAAGGNDKNPPPDFIANLDPDPEPGKDDHKMLKLSARPDGSFTITNLRNNFSKTYPPVP